MTTAPWLAPGKKDEHLYAVVINFYGDVAAESDALTGCGIVAERTTDSLASRRAPTLSLHRTEAHRKASKSESKKCKDFRYGFVLYRSSYGFRGTAQHWTALHRTASRRNAAHRIAKHRKAYR